MDDVILISSGSSGSPSSTDGSFFLNKKSGGTSNATFQSASFQSDSDDESASKRLMRRPLQYSSTDVHSLSDSNEDDEGPIAVADLNLCLGYNQLYRHDLSRSSSPIHRPKASKSYHVDVNNSPESVCNTAGPTMPSSSLQDQEKLVDVLSDGSEDEAGPVINNRKYFSDSFNVGGQNGSSQESLSRAIRPSCSLNLDSQRLVHSLSDDSEDEIAIDLPSSWMKRSHNVISTYDKNKEEIMMDNMYTSSVVDAPTAKHKKKEAVGLISNLNKKELAEERKNLLKLEREKKKLERLAKLADRAKIKAMKLEASKMQKMYKPEECLKYMTAVLDQALFNEQFGGDLKESLSAVEVQYKVQTQTIPMTINWIRKVPVSDIIQVNEETHTMLVVPVERMMKLVKSKGLLEDIQITQSLLLDKKIVLVLHGMEKYFRSQKKSKSCNVLSASREEVTEALIEVQLFAGCDHRLVESSLELATLISQFSKAVAEIPYRLEKNKKDEDKLDWFGESDNHDCVRVDKNGNGLLRLWRQQLCEFNLAGLQMAEAITTTYACPQDLFRAYSSCSTQTEGERLLQDIPIRRGVGALSSVRRIGPELSKKLYTFFTSLGGDAEMSQE